LGELEIVDISDVSSLFASAVIPAGACDVDQGIGRGAAYFRVSSKRVPSDFAVIYTPGDRWFSLEVSGGFSFDYFEEEMPDDEARQLVEKLMRAAVAYIEGRSSVSTSRIFRIPTVQIDVEGGSLDLHLSLSATLKRIFRIPPG
jgi:hypothetical protein